MKTEEFKYLPQIIKRISRVLLEVVVSFFFGWLVSLNFFILSSSISQDMALKPAHKGRNTELQESAWKYRIYHGKSLMKV